MNGRVTLVELPPGHPKINITTVFNYFEKLCFFIFTPYYCVKISNEMELEKLEMVSKQYISSHVLNSN